MKVGCMVTKQLTRKELIDLILKSFPDYDYSGSNDVICVVTEISEYIDDENSKQSIMFVDRLKI